MPSYGTMRRPPNWGASQLPCWQQYTASPLGRAHGTLRFSRYVAEILLIYRAQYCDRQRKGTMRYVFGDYTLDTRLYELRRTGVPDGR